MKQPALNSLTLANLINRVEAYFNYIQGEYHFKKTPAKKTSEVDLVEQKIYDREAEPPTIAGLALFIGFNSREEFDTYERTGKFASVIKRAHLRVEADYEKKLHYQSSSGAMFALKNMGWNEKPENKIPADMVKEIKVRIIESGLQTAASEKEIIL